MRQFVNDCEPGIVYAIMTERQTNHWASIRDVKTSAIKVRLGQVLKGNKINALLVQQLTCFLSNLLDTTRSFLCKQRSHDNNDDCYYI